MSKKVTIIIPVYKGKAYMKEAIDSALAQTYKNLEILVINYGSPDDGETDRIAKSYGDKIRYIYKENGGVSTVLNLALKEMTGDYFSWLSHDDVYYPDKIEVEMNYLSTHNLIDEKVILYSDYDLIDKNSELIAKSIKPHKETQEKPEYAMLRGHINGITLLIPKRAFDECGNFDEKLLCAQDYELWYRMMKAGYKFIHIPQILAKSRMHDKQVTNTNPRVETEGNKFWIDMTDDIDYNVKIRLEGSEYNYYKEMERFLRQTTYQKAADHCLQKMQSIAEKAEKKLSQTKVSIILPFYNNIECVLCSINSVLVQTHENYELILINDNSNEDIMKIEEVVKEHKQIKLINNKQAIGPTQCKNIGIDKAKGKYIAFIEPNAIFHPTKIEMQLKDMLITGDKVSHTSYYNENQKKKELIDNGKYSGQIVSELIHNCHVAISTVMIEKDYLNQNKFRFDNQLGKVTEKCFWLMMLANQKLLGIEKPLTTIYSSNDNLLYDESEQINDMKNILKFVLNHPILQEYNYEIGLLCSNYINCINKHIKSQNVDELIPISVHCNGANCDRVMNNCSHKIKGLLKLSKKGINYIKRNGIKSTIIKIKQVITKKENR